MISFLKVPLPYRLQVSLLVLCSGIWAPDAWTQIHDPAFEQASLKILDGYQVNLFASEALGVIKPIQIRFDARGRLWVAGSTVYPQIVPGQKANDKILILEDTDGDGVADRSTVFADGLMIPTGIEWGDGGLYVGQANELLHLKDTDGDDRADERRVVLRGFGTGDAHQTINSFTWSPGGALFMCQGLHALSRVETPWGTETLNQAGVWRFFPRRLKLDPFWDQAMGPQNPFGVIFDHWGQPIVVAGNGEGVYYLTPGMTRSHERLPMKALWNTGRKFGGGDFVENSLWPAASQGELITGSYLNNTVSRFRISEESSGFKVEDLPPLITSTNLYFRIVDARFGPDGALYLCDWYNSIIGHYQASFRHPDRDKSHGRIWRVTPRGSKPLTRPSLVHQTEEQLMEELNSKERWNRQMAKRILADRPTERVFDAISRRMNSPGFQQNVSPLQLMELLGVCESHEKPHESLLALALSQTEPRVRAYATGTLGRWADRLADPIPSLRRAIQDPHPRVRLEAIIAASSLDRPECLPILLRAVEFPIDPWIEYALTQAIRVSKPAWKDALKSGAISLEESPRAVEWLVRLDRSPDTLDFVRQRFASDALSEPRRESLMAVLADAGSPDDLALLLKPDCCQTAGRLNPKLRARTLDVLRRATRERGIRPTGDLESFLKPLLEDEDSTIQAEALQLAGAWRLASALETLLHRTEDPTRSESTRKAAVTALGQFQVPESITRLTSIASGSGALAPVAVESLASLDLPRAAKSAALCLSHNLDASDVTSLMQTFLSRQGGMAVLESELRSLPPAKSTATQALVALNAAGKRPESLARLLLTAAGYPSRPSEWTPEQLKDFVLEVQQHGEARSGEKIYRRQELTCSACHSIGGVGGNIGPDLGALGTSQTVEFIAGAILFPQKEVKEGFNAVQVTLKNGDEHQGYVVNENSEKLVLRDTLLKQEVTLPRNSIQSKQNLGSVMPAGLADALTREEFRDLVRFLSELGRH